MEYKAYLMILIAIIFASCQTSTKSEESKETETAEEVTESVESVESKSNQNASDVLNPNLATRDQLEEVTHLTQEIVEQILTKRPFIESIDFIRLLESEVPEEVVSDICVNLFVPMNLNTAEESFFLFVPAVGEKMAHEFEEYRPYTSVAQFRREIGKYVDQSQVAAYEKYVFVPVNLNEGSKEEILAIPGVGDKMLHEFEEYRPYESIEQFRREIGKYVDDKELARLERYVTLD